MARFGVQAPRRGSADQSGSAEAMMLLMGIKGEQKHRQFTTVGGHTRPNRLVRPIDGLDAAVGQATQGVPCSSVTALNLEEASPELSWPPYP